MITEEEIRPKATFDEYLILAAIDAESIPVNQRDEVNCPACSSHKNKTQFVKHTFEYKICSDCASLYCSPRPSLESLRWVYTESPSMQYWSNVFWPSVAKKRSQSILLSQVSGVIAEVKKRGLKPKSICDIGAGDGIFLQLLAKHFNEAELYAIEPSKEGASECRKKGIKVAEVMLENVGKEWYNKFDLVISAQLIEHVFDPTVFMQGINSILIQGGGAIVIGLGYEGYDILTLQNKSRAIMPPFHLNFLSIQGFQSIMEKCGFSNIAIETPGQLDFDIAHNSQHRDEFTRVLASRGTEAIAEFQNFLRKWQLSSHIWLMAQK